ncbi:hypothetical protein EBU94_03670 [bacterium]|nr:hypothetical protein [bacterium]
MQVIKPTSTIQEPQHGISIFLAGSIEMGIAQDWQSILEKELANYPVTIFNPRREDWDASWKQEASDPQFHHQVNWEMDKLKLSDLIFMYFSPETKSPISLLELGLHKEDNMIVCCPNGFWRKGNVEIVCHRYLIPLFGDLRESISALKSRLHQMELKKYETK